ncbi:esterase [Siphonobacter sp. SORGH_AS_0500]|uniref:alpha/beta hydrolase n=1 Tax=Siphonobacter sp. SORGH_AS_0500 TaxID=1864824 RepID=UPI000CC58763|nr:alpha/beta hydrolase-fold protein [Siphonobacter sp. SORGH_AS_0500]PKK38363.1 esterase [Siphonobacter sp. SORGH_AS_0500]
MQNRTVSLHSRFLERQVSLTFLLPPNYDESTEAYPLLILNDGQDFERLRLSERVEALYQQEAIPSLMIVGVHANELRLSEYGTAHQPDYKGRGNRAEAHTKFILQELIPYLEERFRLLTDAKARAIAGFSLGGLSALDIAWNHSEVFSKVGVFSGSLWWRSRAYEEGYDDENDRIMHVQIRKSAHRPELKFWLQAGTDDEKDDRNHNGIIDAIDDTLDLMKELKAKGYQPDVDFTYEEVAGGQHNPETWGAIMPVFLKWAFASSF